MLKRKNIQLSQLWFKKFALLSTLFISSFTQANNEQATALKLYTFDCGTIKVSDMDVFSTSGDYKNEQATFTDSCYLIRHEKGDLLWDTGLPASLIGKKPMVNGVFTLSLEKSLVEQLANIDVSPKDIEYLSLSHSHFDHVGQVSSFKQATWLTSQAELDHIASADDLKALNDELSAMKRQTFTQDYDVFGDGSVVILNVPGHTVGHTALQVNLANSGTVLLSGDLYHQAKSRHLKRVPRFNVDEPQTRESFKKFEKIASVKNAKVIIQHEAKHVEKLPDIPQYLD
ncbi:N-acyl homoserine lactonase family protein [Thalassotalea sp. 1_MG-2023]|uniref:N-acyl homoserine lactonase family protein n=1 Tax=Thalassotalea sp. 1_MG-2023 TaxID=3062680 RepID=UPI0026E245DF|nr:N-acyl homoserine lactonase family protein [Thalassotalea sp. 1_MG-2023]MDO6426004.1 N-acyl homoserine lactonase family protein [Thalassotalea sp. 1_MG-2023]